MTRSASLCVALGHAWACWPHLSRADPALDALVAAYPDHLAGHDGNELIWKDGTRMPISDGRSGKSFEELLDNPDIKDQFAIPYPLGADLKVPAVNEDPGRIRNERFFSQDVWRLPQGRGRQAPPAGGVDAAIAAAAPSRRPPSTASTNGSPLW